MAEAARDQNQVTTILADSNADGTTPLRADAVEASHRLRVSDGVAGSDLSGDIAARDGSGYTVIMAVSNADGTTPCPVYIDAVTNRLLIKST